MKPKDIDHIIDLISKINKLHFRNFPDKDKKWHYLDKYAGPLEKELELFLAPRWEELTELSDNPKFLDSIDELHIHPSHLPAPPFPPKTKQQDEEKRRSERKAYTDIVIQKLNCIKAKLEYRSKRTKEQKVESENGNNIPDDIVRFAIAVDKFIVSRATLKRAIENGQLKSYRPRNAKRNSPHLVSEKDVASLYQHRKSSIK